MARHTEKKFKRNTEGTPFVITYTAWKYLYQGKQSKKKEEKLAVVGKNKDKIRKKWKRKEQVNLVLKKNGDKMGKCFNCTKSVKLTDLVCTLCNKLYHNKCGPHNHKIRILEKYDCYASHIFWVRRLFLWFGSGWFRIDNILNYVALVGANKYAAYWK